MWLFCGSASPSRMLPPPASAGAWAGFARNSSLFVTLTYCWITWSSQYVLPIVIVTFSSLSRSKPKLQCRCGASSLCLYRWVMQSQFWKKIFFLFFFVFFWLFSLRVTMYPIGICEPMAVLRVVYRTWHSCLHTSCSWSDTVGIQWMLLCEQGLLEQVGWNTLRLEPTSTS